MYTLQFHVHIITTTIFICSRRLFNENGLPSPLTCIVYTCTHLISRSMRIRRKKDLQEKSETATSDVNVSCPHVWEREREYVSVDWLWKILCREVIQAQQQLTTILLLTDCHHYCQQNLLLFRILWVWNPTCWPNIAGSSVSTHTKQMN